MKHDEIKGFTDQTEQNKQLVNVNKEVEERLLRITDGLREDPAHDQRFISMAISYFQIGFMLLNRGIFQPQRIELPEDKEPEEPKPAVYVGEVFHTVKSGKPCGENGQELIAQGPHWYVKSEWDNYQRRLNGEPEVPTNPASDIETHED